MSVFDKVGVIRSRALGDEVAACLGSRCAMLLRGHGANVAEDNVRLAALKAIFLEDELPAAWKHSTREAVDFFQNRLPGSAEPARP